MQEPWPYTQGSINEPLACTMGEIYFWRNEMDRIFMATGKGENQSSQAEVNNPMKVGDMLSLKVGTEVFPSNDLSSVIQFNDGGCVYSISLHTGAAATAYDYRILVDGRGPKGAGSGSGYLHFTDESGDTYKLSLFSSSRKTHTLDYNSDKPNIVTIRWNS
jgi:hypothetical protein